MRRKFSSKKDEKKDETFGISQRRGQWPCSVATIQLGPLMLEKLGYKEACTPRGLASTGSKAAGPICQPTGLIPGCKMSDPLEQSLEAPPVSPGMAPTKKINICIREAPREM